MDEQETSRVRVQELIVDTKVVDLYNVDEELENEAWRARSGRLIRTMKTLETMQLRRNRKFVEHRPLRRSLSR